MQSRISLILSAFLLFTNVLSAQDYDPDLISKENLPDPLVTTSGEAVTSPEMWISERAPEIKDLVEKELYGRAPGPPEGMVSNVIKEHTTGEVTYKQVEVKLTQGGKSTVADLLICLPANADEPVPVFLGMNFSGNHSITRDTGIIIDNKYSDTPRGQYEGRWPVEMVTARGYGIVTLSRTGGQGLYPDMNGPGDWGAISSWTWALKRMVDYLETDPDVDHARIAAVGTSRLGKVALWAGATDERIHMVMPSCSGGCGGVSLMSKRFYGEDSDELMGGIGLNKVADNFEKYLLNEAVLPFDQHMVIALIAPRPIYVATADGQNEPHNHGMYLALRYAEPVYTLLGAEGFGANEMPGIQEPVMSISMGFHIRTGKHGIEPYDWEQFLDFADFQYNIATPENLTGNVVEDKISLDWDDNNQSILSGYQVFRSSNAGSDFYQINDSLIVKSEFIDSTVVPGETYYYVIAAVDSHGKVSDYSNEVQLTIPPIAVTAGLQDHQRMRIYPNPSSIGMLYIETSNLLDNTILMLTNAAGAVIYKERLSKNLTEIPLDRCTSGIYNLRIVDRTSILNYKLIIA